MLFVKYVFLVCLLLSGCTQARQPADYTGTADFRANELFQRSNGLFNAEKVRVIRIEMDPDALDDVVLARFGVNGEQQYALAHSFSMDAEVLTNVGIRSRGGTSAKNYKRQFKISFNAHTTYSAADEEAVVDRPGLRGRTFHGVRKLNLRASQNDPTIIREKVASHVFQEAGAIAPRNGFAEVYINDAYWGLYLITEQIDEAFLSSRFGEKNGTVFKGQRGAARFNSAQMYRGFDLKTSNTNHRALGAFFDTLQEGIPDAAAASKLVDIHNVLDYLAAASLVGHWDSFAYLGNNDYLYHHSDGRFRILCWDLDNTFGSGRGWNFPVLESSVFAMSENENYGKLFSIIIEDPEWNRIYRDKVQRLLDTVFNPDLLFPKVAAWRELIRDSVQRDPRKRRDWRYDDDEAAYIAWEQGFEQKPDAWQGRGFGDYEGGLQGWISERYAIVRIELDAQE